MWRFAQITMTTAFLGLCAFPGGAIARTKAPLGRQPNQNTASGNLAFTSAYTPARTSTNQRLWVQIVTSGDSSSGFSLMVNLKSGNDPLAAPFEFHQWSFQLTGRSLTYSSKDGTGTLDVVNQIQPYGQISLRLHRVSTEATGCGSGNGTSKADTVTVTGTMAFNTQTRAWGMTAPSTGTFSFASGSSIRYQNCSRVPTAPAPESFRVTSGEAQGISSMTKRR